MGCTVPPEELGCRHVVSPALQKRGDALVRLESARHSSHLHAAASAGPIWVEFVGAARAVQFHVSRSRAVERRADAWSGQAQRHANQKREELIIHIRSS